MELRKEKRTTVIIITCHLCSDVSSMHIHICKVYKKPGDKWASERILILKESMEMRMHRMIKKMDLGSIMCIRQRHHGLWILKMKW